MYEKGRRFRRPFLAAQRRVSAASAIALRWPSTVRGSALSPKPIGFYCFSNFIFCGTLYSSTVSVFILLIRQADVVAAPAPCANAVLLESLDIFRIATDHKPSQVVQRTRLRTPVGLPASWLPTTLFRGNRDALRSPIDARNRQRP